MRITSSDIQPVCPPGWYYKTSVTLLSRDGQANVIASTEPLDPSIDTGRYAMVQLDLLRRDFPQFTEHASGWLDLSGVAAFWRRFSWTPSNGLPVTQMQLYAASGSRGYTATATTPTVNWDRFEEVFHDVFRSMIVNPAAGVADESTAPPADDRTLPSARFAALFPLPSQIIMAGAGSEWRLFMPQQPLLRTRLEALTAAAAAAVQSASDYFGRGPVKYPPVTLISSPATRDNVVGISVNMFSMIHRVENGDPFASVRSAGHARINNAWNATANLDIRLALVELGHACAEVERQQPVLRDDVDDLVVTGSHLVSVLDALAGRIDRQ